MQDYHQRKRRRSELAGADKNLRGESDNKRAQRESAIAAGGISREAAKQKAAEEKRLLAEEKAAAKAARKQSSVSGTELSPDTAELSPAAKSSAPSPQPVFDKAEKKPEYSGPNMELLYNPQRPKSVKKRTGLKIFCCVLAALIVASGLSGYLNWYDLVKMYEDSKKTPTEITTLYQADPTYYAGRYDYTPQSYTAATTGVYERIFAVELVIGTDYFTDPAEDLETVKSRLTETIDFVADMQADTVILQLQSQWGSLAAISGRDALLDGSLAEFAISHAREKGLAVAISYCPMSWYEGGSELLLDPMSAADRAIMAEDAKQVAALGADTVILSDCRYREGQGSYAAYAALNLGSGFEQYKRSCISDALFAVSQALRAGAETRVGICVQPVWKLSSDSAYGIEVKADYSDYFDGCADTKAWISAGIFDFVQVLDFGSLTDEDAPFETVYDWWSAAAAEADVALFITHAADKAAGSGGWKLYDQLPKQVIEVMDDENYGGSVFYTVSRLMEYQEIANVLTQTVKGEVDGDDILRKLAITSPTKKKTTTYNKTLNLSGSSDPNFSVTINGKVIDRTTKGYFTLNFDLEIGKNTYEISHKGTTTTYTVTREVLVFKSVAPSESLTVYAGTPVVFTALALRGSTVYAEIDGKQVKMTETELQTEEITDENSDYAKFTGMYTVPENSKTRTITDIKIHGDWEGHKDTKSCADVKVKEIDKTTVRVATVVRAAGAETFRYGTVDNKSTPISYPLPQGTSDYIVGEVIYQDVEDGNTVYVYYLLASGKRVYKSENGQDYGDVSVSYGVSVANNAIAGSSGSVSSKYTTLEFEMGSKTPFTVQLAPQTYKDSVSTDPNFTVSDFTADSVVITFNYCVSVPELPQFANSPLFSGTSGWESDGTNYSIVLYLAEPGAFFGLYTYYEGNTLVFDFVNPPVMSTASNSYGYSLSGITVMIDAGHGGNSSGAVGPNPNYPEKRINLELSLKIADVLEGLGARVILTRSDDTYLTLQQRVDLVAKYKPNFFISVHHNWANAVSAKGVSTFYYTPFSQDFSGAIYDNLISAYESNIHTGSGYKRGNMYGPYYVTRYWYCPSTLLEYGFVSNSAELQKLIDPSVQSAYARATVRGIIDYIKQYGTISGTPITPEPETDPTTSSGTSSIIETEEGFYDENGNFTYWEKPTT